MSSRDERVGAGTGPGGDEATLTAEVGHDATLAAGAATTPQPGLAVRDPARYERRGEIARGGMGRIVAARDRELGRGLAIKEVIAPSPALERRFEREVRITARLQHPSIIGVLEAGRWPSGEPFFTMKRIEGRPFDELIAARRTLPERLALLPNVIAVAEALAYAHSEGVLHRDLKPANVLAGPFGETVVIDWGLAKDLSDAEDPADPDPDGAGDEAGLTVVGQAMGTPAYMPPEQARGEAVDARADVYALGAMLYHLLAGAMPYRDTEPASARELVETVKQRGPTPLGQLEPKAPADLRAIVDKALARDPADRYPSAAELAADLRRFETGQLVSVHDYSTAALLKRWLARHRASVAVAAAMTVLLVVGGAVSVARIARERDRATEQQRVAEANREEVEELLGFMLVNLRDELAPIGKLPLLDLVATQAADYHGKRPIDWSRPREAWMRALALENLGEIHEARGDLDAALARSRAALALLERLVRQEPDNPQWQWGLSRSRHRAGSVLLVRGDLDEALAQYRAALAIRTRSAALTPDHTGWQRSLAQTHERIGEIHRLRGELDGALAEYRTSLAIVERLASRAPDDAEWQRLLAVSHERIGKIFEARHDLPGALAQHQTSLAIRERLVERDPSNSEWQRDVAASHSNLSGLLGSHGDSDRALTAIRTSLEITERLVRHDPSNNLWQRDLALAYLGLGRQHATRGEPDLARDALARSTALYATSAVGPKDFYNAACAHAMSSDPDRAFELLDTALARGFRGADIVANDPDLAALHADPRWQPLLTRLRQLEPR